VTGLAASGWLALGCGVSHAADTTAHFTLQPRAVIDVARDRPGEDVVESWTWMRATAAGPARSGRWFLEVQADYVVLVGAPDAGDVEAAPNLWMGESGWAGDLGPVFVRAGHLVDRWGAMDLLPVTDVLNGQDLRAGPLVPIEHARVPAPMVRIETGQDQLRFGLVALPFGARSRVPLWGTDYSLVRQGMVEGLVDDAASWSTDPLLAERYRQLFTDLSNDLATLDAQTRRGLESALGTAGGPRPLYEAAELGLEAQSRLGPVDLAVTGAWLRSRVPAPRIDAGLQQALRDRTLPDTAALTGSESLVLPSAQSDRPRTWVAGLAAGTLLGSIGLRGETSYTHTAVLSEPWLDYATTPMWTTGVAIDRAASTRLSALIEGRWRHFTRPPPRAQLVGVPDQMEVAAGLRSTLARERLTIELGGLYDITFAELAAQPAARFRCSDTLDLGVGAVVLASPASPASTWEHLMDYRGGLIGYSSDTDAIWLDMRWLR